MNILYYVPYIGRKDGGIYQYSIGLLKILSKANLQHEFYIYHTKETPEIINITNEASNFHLITTKEPFRKKIYRKIIELIKLIFEQWLKKDFRIHTPTHINHILKKYKIDLVHTPYQEVIRTPDIIGVTTMHDVQELHFPGFFSARERALRAVNRKETIDYADAIIVSYQHIKNDIVKYFEKPSEQIYTVLLDMENLWFDQFKAKNTKFVSIFDEFGKFILYPAATWRHKNHIRLLEAIYYLKKNKNINISLICTGKKKRIFS